MYIGDIYRLGNQGASASKIEQYLRWVEVERMELIDERSAPLLAESVRKSATLSLETLHR